MGAMGTSIEESEEYGTSACKGEQGLCFACPYRDECKRYEREINAP